MTKILLLILFSPLIISAQDPKPDYKNDTLYTTCGYTIYKGKTLQIGTGTGKKGQFRHILIKNDIAINSLVNNSIVVTELTNVKLWPLDAGYADITGTFIFKDSTSGTVELKIAFDRAIENNPNLASELAVPPEFRNSSRVILHQKLNVLFNLYTRGALSKTEYETQKDKLLKN